MRYAFWRCQERTFCSAEIMKQQKYCGYRFIACRLQGVRSQSKRILNDVIAQLPYYLEKGSSKNVRDLPLNIWKLNKSNQ